MMPILGVICALFQADCIPVARGFSHTYQLKCRENSNLRPLVYKSKALFQYARSSWQPSGKICLQLPKPILAIKTSKENFPMHWRFIKVLVEYVGR
ncbi:Tyrosyl-tRNA synthetase, class Ib, bacterial/mitochondrial [Prunus dulcis]|uniref:Tyrosyl-tRNA synthetase, class Ib, bacterial/mitochondrial n=1 Tax=Prunus dulcis TaxID=3755 RepID=A0A4Y1QWG0_PRUDU|nr:Tyrosyl-tRNA synthetase, class Ib, bacterial/mitochondrial [Prunus dulcis]